MPKSTKIINAILMGNIGKIEKIIGEIPIVLKQSFKVSECNQVVQQIRGDGKIKSIWDNFNLLELAWSVEQDNHDKKLEILDLLIARGAYSYELSVKLFEYNYIEQGLKNLKNLCTYNDEPNETKFFLNKFDLKNIIEKTLGTNINLSKFSECLQYLKALNGPSDSVSLTEKNKPKVIFDALKNVLKYSNNFYLNDQTIDALKLLDQLQLNKLFLVAAQNNHTELVKFLLNKNINPNVVEKNSDKTPLDYAMQYKNIKMAKELVKHGAQYLYFLDKEKNLNSEFKTIAFLSKNLNEKISLIENIKTIFKPSIRAKISGIFQKTLEEQLIESFNKKMKVFEPKQAFREAASEISRKDLTKEKLFFLKLEIVNEFLFHQEEQLLKQFSVQKHNA